MWRDSSLSTRFSPPYFYLIFDCVQVSGNFHIALGESVVRDGRHIHSFKPEDAPKFNISHSVHSLEFMDFDEPDLGKLHDLLELKIDDICLNMLV